MVDFPAMWLIKEEGKPVTNGRFTRIPPASLAKIAPLTLEDCQNKPHLLLWTGKGHQQRLTSADQKSRVGNYFQSWPMTSADYKNRGLWGQHKYIYIYTYTCVTYIISISASMSISMFVLGVDTKHPFCPHFLTIPARSDVGFVAVLLRIGFLVPKAGFDCPSNEFVAETALGIHHSSPSCTIIHH